MRHDHAITLCNEERRNFGETVYRVGPAVQQHDHGALRWTALGVTDIEDVGIDLLQRAERSACCVHNWRSRRLDS